MYSDFLERRSRETLERAVDMTNPKIHLYRCWQRTCDNGRPGVVHPYIELADDPLTLSQNGHHPRCELCDCALTYLGPQLEREITDDKEKSGFKRLNMTYPQALKQARKVGAAHAEGDALLAQTVYAVSSLHAVNPEMIYDGAVKLGKTPKQVAELAAHDCIAFGNLMFV